MHSGVWFVFLSTIVTGLILSPLSILLCAYCNQFRSYNINSVIHETHDLITNWEADGQAVQFVAAIHAGRTLS